VFIFSRRRAEQRKAAIQTPSWFFMTFMVQCRSKVKTPLSARYVGSFAYMTSKRVLF
jgi:hypothetical protein